MNIVGKLNRSEITNCPESATFALMSKNGESFIQLFYRETERVCNDKTIAKVLEYESFTGVWVGSTMDKYQLVEAKFKTIEG